MTPSQLQSLVLNGGSIIIDATNITALSIQSLALSAKTHNAVIIIKHSSKLTPLQCNAIAFAGGRKGNIIFDFTD